MYNETYIICANERFNIFCSRKRNINKIVFTKLYVFKISSTPVSYNWFVGTTYLADQYWEYHKVSLTIMNQISDNDGQSAHSYVLNRFTEYGFIWKYSFKRFDSNSDFTK